MITIVAVVAIIGLLTITLHSGAFVSGQNTAGEASSTRAIVGPNWGQSNQIVGPNWNQGNKIVGPNWDAQAPPPTR